MMKQHRTTKLRSFGGAAALVTLLVGGLGLSSAVAGTASEEASPVVEKVIIIKKRGDGKGDGDPVKVMRLNGIEEACAGEKTEVNAGGDGDARRTRLIFCGDPSLTPAQRAEKLEQVRSRLAQNDALGEEHRAKVEAALAAEISRLRAGSE